MKDPKENYEEKAPEKPIRDTNDSGNDSFEKYRSILGPFPGGEKGIRDWIRDMREDEDPQ